MGLNESRPIAVGPLTMKKIEEAVNWFKNFKPRKDNSRDYIKNIPIRLPENPAQKVWSMMHHIPNYDISDVYYYKSELSKCLDSEEYFYNNYCLINGKKPNPVPDGYFRTLRILQGRRKGGYNFSMFSINTPEESEKKFEEYFIKHSPFSVQVKDFMNITTTSNTA